MLLALALASSLWASAQEAGACALHDVRPMLHSSDSGYGCSGDTEPVGDGFLCPDGTSDSDDVSLGEFGEPMLLTSHLSPLGDHIGGIVSVAPDVEMENVDATADIAPVEHAHASRDRAIDHFPRESVGETHSAFDPEPSITVRIDAGGPKQTSARFAAVYLRPESLRSSYFLDSDDAAEKLRLLSMNERNTTLPANAGRLSSSHDDLLGVDWSGTREGSKPSRASDNTLLSAALSADREPPQEVFQVEKIADEFATDLAWLISSHAADLYSTAWALRRGATEANPLGPDVESRLALKMASCATTGLTLWKLRRDGHGRSATIIRWLYVAGNGLLVVNNVYQGSK